MHTTHERTDHEKRFAIGFILLLGTTVVVAGTAAVFENTMGINNQTWLKAFAFVLGVIALSYLAGYAVTDMRQDIERWREEGL